MGLLCFQYLLIRKYQLIGWIFTIEQKDHEEDIL